MLKEADRSPGCSDSARDECGVAEDSRSQFVEVEEGGVVEFAVGWNGDHQEDCCEEARETREDPNPVGEIGSKARRVAWM